jgi:hypothetical protein
VGHIDLAADLQNIGRIFKLVRDARHMPGIGGHIFADLPVTPGSR